MTKITIIAATELEMTPIMSYFGDKFTYYVSGVGPVASAIATMKAIAEHKPNLVLGVGIAGAVDRELQIEEAVIVARDYIADLGAIRGDGHFEAFDSPRVEYPYIVDGFRSVRARTVSVACAPFIADDSQIETMEGASMMLTAKALGVRFMQLRTISNYVDDKREHWQIERAVQALPAAVARLLKF